MSYDYRDMGGVPIAAINIDSGQRGLFTAIVTPEDAEQLLVRNVRNRKLNMNTVERYAHEMTLGEWDWCEGDDTKLEFGVDGTLMNGQHHLHAQIKANVTGAYDIRTGVPLHAYKHMDSGAKRRVADYFAGKDLPGDVSALGTAVVAAKHGLTSWSGGRFSRASTRKELFDETEANYDQLVKTVRLAKRTRDQFGRGSVAGVGLALWMMAHRDGNEAVEAFTDDFVDGDRETAATKHVIMRRIASYKGGIKMNWWTGVILLAYKGWKDNKPIKRVNDNDVMSALKREVDVYANQGNGDSLIAEDGQ